MEIELKAHAEAVTLNPGDVVVIRTEQLITAQQHEWIMHHLQPVFPDNRLIILPHGFSLSIVKPERDEFTAGDAGAEAFVPRGEV